MISVNVPQQALFAFRRWRSRPILPEGFCVYSLATFFAFLSSRTPTNLLCRRWPSDVYSTNSNCPTTCASATDIHHLGGGQTCAPTPGFFLRQIRERAFLDFQRFKLLEQLRSRRGRASTARPRSIDQPVALVVTDNQRVEILKRWRVSGDDELVSLIDTHFLPSTRA